MWEDNCYHAEQWIPHQFFDRGWKRTERWEEAEIVWTSAADLGDLSNLDREQVVHCLLMSLVITTSGLGLFTCNVKKFTCYLSQRSNHIKNVSDVLGLKSEMHKTIRWAWLTDSSIY